MNRTFIGVLLLFLGGALLLQNLGVLEGDWVLFLIGIFFLGAYYVSGKGTEQRSIGFLIPGVILLMVGFFNSLEEIWGLQDIEESLFFSFVGLAFILIYLIHTRNLGTGRGGKNWPLYTGLALVGFNIFIVLVRTVEGASDKSIA